MIACAKAISDGGTALVFLCSVLPGLCVKLSAPFWFDRVSYRARLLAASVLMVASFSTVAAFSGEESANMYMELFGVSLCSVQGSMGEASLLALAGKYDNKAQDEAVANASRTGRGDDGSMNIKSKKGKCIIWHRPGRCFWIRIQILVQPILRSDAPKDAAACQCLGIFSMDKNRQGG